MNRSVLIIEESKSLKERLRIALEKEEWAVFDADNGEDGLRLYVENKPRVVVLNYQLPNTNCIELLKKLKQEGMGARSVIMLAESDDDLVIRTCFRLGINTFMPKTVNPLILMGLLSQAIKHIAAMKEVRKLQGAVKKLQDSQESLIDEQRESQATIEALHQQLSNATLQDQTMALIEDGPSNLTEYLLEHMNEAMILLDEGLEVTLVSQATKKLFGEVVAGTHISEYLGDDFSQEGSPLMCCVAGRVKLANIRTTIRPLSGHTIDCGLTIVPGPDMGWVLFFNSNSTPLAKTNVETPPESEREFLLKVLESVNYKKGLAAKKLGVNQSTLYRKMKKYGIGQS